MQKIQPDKTQHSRYRHPCLPAGFELAIPASKRLRTHGLDSAAIVPAHL